jgi:tryptophan synthase alpha subunit
LTPGVAQDPLADGPTIQAAATRALAAGTTLDGVLAMVARVAPDINAQLVMFTYYNPIMRRGAERFCQQAKAAGASGAHYTREACRAHLSVWFLLTAMWLVGERNAFAWGRAVTSAGRLLGAMVTMLSGGTASSPRKLSDQCAARLHCVGCPVKLWAGHAGRGLSGRSAAGLLVPDIPLEETGDIRRIASAAGLELVMLATPTTPEARMREIAAVSQGFVYLVSVTGVTGQRTKTESRVEGLIELLHSVTDKPVAVGFGVSGPEQARPGLAVRYACNTERAETGLR